MVTVFRYGGYIIIVGRFSLVTKGNTAGIFRAGLLGQVVTVVSHSISWGAICNKDDQREVPKPVCRANAPPAQGHASLGQEEM